MDASAGLDGELSHFRQRRVLRHTRGCAECATAVAKMESVSLLIRHAGSAAPPLVEVAAPAQRRRRRIAFAPGWAVGAVAVVAIAFVMLVSAPAHVDRSEELATIPATNVSYPVGLQSVIDQHHRVAVMHQRLPPLARNLVG